MRIRTEWPESIKGLKDRHKIFCDLPDLKKNRLSCPICKDILVEPRQSHCGCRFCYSCIYVKGMAQCEGSNHWCCPGCNEVMNALNNTMLPDRAVEKEIFEQHIICVNGGCGYKCRLKDLSDHLKRCEYRNERCGVCCKEYFHKDLKVHQRRECVMKRVECVDCGMSMTKENFISKHRNVNGTIDELCDNWRGVCPYRCGRERQNSIKMHLRECRRMPICCDIKRFGCSKVLEREEMEVHMNTETMYHMILMSQAIDDLRKEKDKEVSRSSEAVKNLNTENYALSQTVSRIALEVSTLKTKVETYERNLGSQGGTPVYSSPPSSNPLSKHSIYSSPSLARIVTGDFTWTIEGIRGKIHDAKRGINMILISDPFYSNSPGYKMCLKIYPHGDGRATGTHLSLYFVVMKGDYDEQISWPFNKKVSLSLVTGRVGESDRTINMMPDTNENCYGRPKGTYNLAAGQPHFVSHTDLMSDDRYVLNEAITITARVFS